jgi:hypothetical protein
MVATRTQLCSPFPEDGATSANGFCGQVIFLGGDDMQGPSPAVTNVAYILRKPMDQNIP